MNRVDSKWNITTTYIFLHYIFFGLCIFIRQQTYSYGIPCNEKREWMRKSGTFSIQSYPSRANISLMFRQGRKIKIFNYQIQLCSYLPTPSFFTRRNTKKNIVCWRKRMHSLFFLVSVTPASCAIQYYSSNSIFFNNNNNNKKKHQQQTYRKYTISILCFSDDFMLSSILFFPQFSTWTNTRKIGCLAEIGLESNIGHTHAHGCIESTAGGYAQWP